MAIVLLRKFQLPLDRLEVRLLAQWIHERIGLQFHQPRITQSHRGVEPLQSFSGDLHQARYHERDERAHLVSVQDVSSEHTHAPPAKFITHVGASSAAPRTRAPQPIYAFISPLTKASRSAFTFSGSVIAIPCAPPG